jgi:hypothetical protein
MPRDRSLGWLVVTAVLVLPVVVYDRFQPIPREAPSPQPVRKTLMPREALFQKEKPAPKSVEPPPPPPVVEDKPLEKDPTLSPYDRVRIELAANPPPAPMPVIPRTPPPPPRPPIERRLRVEAIITLEGRPAGAIVNGEAVSVGDKVKGAKILEIAGDAVTFRYGRRTITKTVGD